MTKSSVKFKMSKMKLCKFFNDLIDLLVIKQDITIAIDCLRHLLKRSYLVLCMKRGLLITFFFDILALNIFSFHIDFVFSL